MVFFIFHRYFIHDASCVMLNTVWGGYWRTLDQAVSINVVDVSADCQSCCLPIVLRALLLAFLVARRQRRRRGSVVNNENR